MESRVHLMEVSRRSVDGSLTNRSFGVFREKNCRGRFSGCMFFVDHFKRIRLLRWLCCCQSAVFQFIT